MRSKLWGIAVFVLAIMMLLLWRENREMARRIRLLEGSEVLVNQRMLEIQEERLRLERLRFFGLP